MPTCRSQEAWVRWEKIAPWLLPLAGSGGLGVFSKSLLGLCLSAGPLCEVHPHLWIWGPPVDFRLVGSQPPPPPGSSLCRTPALLAKPTWPHRGLLSLSCFLLASLTRGLAGPQMELVISRRALGARAARQKHKRTGCTRTFSLPHTCSHQRGLGKEGSTGRQPPSRCQRIQDGTQQPGASPASPQEAWGVHCPPGLQPVFQL